MKKHYHFIGIGGIGMGTLAELLLEKQISVSGSDIKENKTIIRLRQKGAVINIGHDSSNIGRADCVVYSSAIRQDNCEFKEASACSKDAPSCSFKHILLNLCFPCSVIK